VVHFVEEVAAVGRKTVKYTIDKVPAKLRWHPRVSGWGLFFGAIGGLGGVVFLQQAGLRVLTRVFSLQGLSAALISGLVIPSFIYFVTVRGYNWRLRRYLRGARGRASSATAVVAVLAVAASAVLVATASPAYATVTGPCRASLNGVNVAPLAPTAEQAIVVDAEGELTGLLEFPSEIDGGSIDVMYAGFAAFNFQKWDEVVNDEDAVDTGGGAESRTVQTSDIAKYAAGVYDVYGAVVFENGQSCEVAFAFKIDAPPLETPLGQGAAGATAIGILGTLGVAIGRTREGAALLAGLDRQLDSLPIPDPLDQGPVEDEPEQLDHGPVTEFPGDGSDASNRAPEASFPESDLPSPTVYIERGATPVPDLSFDVPDTDVPEVDVPDSDVPEVATPEVSFPEADVPEEVVVPQDRPPVPGARPQDFMGRDTADTVASTVAAVQQAGADLDSMANDLGVSDDVRERVRERIKPAADRLESIKGDAERVRDAVDWAKDIGDDTERRLAGLGVPQQLRDGIVWMRGMFGWVGGIAQDAATTYLAPVTEPIGKILGVKPDKVASELFPVGEFGTQLGDMVIKGAENIKGGANYGGQLAELAPDIPGDAGNTGLDEIFGPNRWGR
jgi:hypothetical protein